MIFQRAYIDSSYGQVHIHIWGNLDASSRVVLALPPSPYSGRAYNTVGPILARQIPMIAIDYPGYGNSTPLNKGTSISDYASAACDVINALCSDKAVTLLGFHTGCLVAIETDLLSHANIEKSILIDVPFFGSERRKGLKSKRLGRLDISADLTSVSSAWEMSVSRQLKNIPIERAFEMFVDQLSTGDRAGDAFEAAFSYDCEAKMRAVNTPSVVIATAAGLYDESVETAKAIKSCKLIKAPELKVSILEKEAAAISQYIITQVS